MTRTVLVIGLLILIGVGLAIWYSTSTRQTATRKIHKEQPVAQRVEEIQWIPIQILKGTTLEDISRYTKISIKEILKRNPGLHSKIIPEGTIIFLPRVKEIFKLPSIMAVKASMVQSLGDDVVAIVHYHPRPGDTIPKIIRKFRTTADLLEAVNPASSLATLIEKGKVIYIPIRSRKVLKLPEKVFRYKIKAGDTLWGLMKRFHVSLSQLEGLNPDYDFKHLRAGTYINIPRHTH